jgi:hypothetical protein
MSAFTLHWSPVRSTDARAQVPAGLSLFALWPAPVNADACFTAAGFTDFGDADADWEREADRVLDRLLEQLATFGTPELRSVPITPRERVISRLFRPVEPLPLRAQVELPMQWDSLPACVLAFGDRGVTLRTGHGHHLFWITLPDAGDPDAADAPTVIVQAAGSSPLLRTALDWQYLL